MTKKYKYLLLLFAVLISINSKAQLVYQDAGDLKMLANEKTLCVKYDYSEMLMSDGSTEAVFLGKMKKELNETREGRGDEFITNWHAAKKEKWEYKFEELFNKHEGKINIGQSYTDAKYTLVVKTTIIFPGQLSSAGLGGIPSWITCEFIIVETAKPDVILSKSIIKHVNGAPYCTTDNPGHCVQEAYAKIAKSYSAHVKKSKK